MGLVARQAGGSTELSGLTRSRFSASLCSGAAKAFCLNTKWCALLFFCSFFFLFLGIRFERHSLLPEAWGLVLHLCPSAKFT